MTQTDDMIKDIEIIQYEHGWERLSSPVVRETSLSVFLNDECIVTLICTNNSMEFLAIGFLAIEGFINPDDMDRTKIIRMGEEAINIKASISKMAPCKGQKTITPGLGKGITFSKGNQRLKSVRILSQIRISVNQVFHLLKQLSERSGLYKLTHGVHNAAICRPGGMDIFQSDIGRHNAIDKLYGQCLSEKIPLSDKIIVTSGRVSSEILTKVGLMGIPILISRSAPTDKAVRLAEEIGLTLIARVRGHKMSIYTHPERVSLE